MMDADRYTIGWIAPLPLELTAAKAIFDDGYHDIPVGDYTYHGGKIREHYVVMAVQPRMGTDAASDLAARMRSAFQSLKCFLVVGIGGGVRGYGPHGATSQIVLGDVVVSVPMGKHGGVVRYDAGAWAGEGTLETKGHTNSPPSFLLNAVASLRSKHVMSPGTNISTFLEQIRNRLNTNEQVKFADLGSENDWLFRDNFPHPPDSRDKSCDDVCDRGQSQSRQSRGEEAVRGLDAPRIHYGNIGSSNQLQISASKRNRCQKEHGVICFEMEGAGVIQTHPCLVIRGICDYADSHKNKKWQPYAAATAAAYAKELLYEIPASQVSLAAGNINEYALSNQANHFSGPINTTGGRANIGNTFNSGGGSMNF